jgi:DNA-binding XRE family transcriptional regulator
MATKTKTSAGSKRAKSAITVVPVRGLRGKGLIQLGKESRLELRDRLQMPRVVFGRVVNVSERTIAKVEAKAEQVEKLRRPYNEVYRLCEALSEVVDPDSLGGWFQTPNNAFDGLKPIEVIERGEIDRLWEMVYRLGSGIPG